MSPSEIHDEGTCRAIAHRLLPLAAPLQRILGHGHSMASDSSDSPRVKPIFRGATKSIGVAAMSALRSLVVLHRD